MKKMRFKRGLTFGALAMAFAFSAPLLVGCNKDDKDKVKEPDTQTLQELQTELDNIKNSSREYTVNYSYGIASEDVSTYFDVTQVKTTQKVKAYERLMDIPEIKDAYKDVFLGWFIQDVSDPVEVKNGEFAGANMTLVAKWANTFAYNCEVVFDDSDNMNPLYKAVIDASKSKVIVPSKYFDEALDPDELQDVTVVEAKEQESGTELTLSEVILPDGITTIAANTFKDCTNLASVAIPASVTTLDATTFNGCSSLISINVSEDNETYSSVDGVLYNEAKTTLLRYPAAKSVATEEGEVVAVTVPAGVTTIATRAFSGCSDITSISIPDSITNMNASAFAGCSAITRIDITDLSKWCGITFDGAYCNPLVYGNAILYVNGQSTVNLVIPDDVTIIKARAFRGYNLLESVTIPSTVTTIQSLAFNKNGSSADSGVNVYYDGSYEEWKLFKNSSDFVTNNVSGISEPSNYQLTSGNIYYKISSVDNIMVNDINDADNKLGGYWSKTGEGQDQQVQVYQLKETAADDAHAGIKYVVYGEEAIIKGVNYTVLAEATTIDIPDTMDSKPVTRIAPNAINGALDSLTGIIVPDSVHYVGKDSLYGVINNAGFTIYLKVAYSEFVTDDYVFVMDETNEAAYSAKARFYVESEPEGEVTYYCWWYGTNNEISTADPAVAP